MMYKFCCTYRPDQHITKWNYENAIEDLMFHVCAKHTGVIKEFTLPVNEDSTIKPTGILCAIDLQ